MGVQRRTCPECGETKLLRVTRKGFLQNRVWRWFGWAPWQCKGCKTSFRLKDRGATKRIDSKKNSGRTEQSRGESDLKMRHGD